MTDPTPNEGQAPDPLSAQAGIAPEVSRRVSSILDAVEREATQLRAEAREEARRYLDFSRRRADDLVAERQRRIAELSDEIMAKAEAVVGRLDDAAPVRAGFENLVRALGDAAERLARESESTAHEFEPPSFHDEQIQSYAPPPAQQQPAPPPPPEPEPLETYQPYVPPPAPQQQPPQAAPPPPAPQAPPGPPPGTGIPGAGVAPPYPAQPQAPPARPPAPPAPAPAGGENWQGVDDARLVGIQMAAAGRTRGQVREHLQNQMGLGDTRSILDEIYGPGSPEDARVPWTAFPS